MTRLTTTLICSMALLAQTVMADGFQWGRELDEARDVRVGLSVGQFQDMKLFVEETRRLVYDVTDRSFKNAAAESFGLSDFDLSDSYTGIGFLYENQARYFTFQFDFNLMNPSTTTTARRNYYIGVGSDVMYNGVGYDQMQIPKGSTIDFETIGGTFQIRGQFTPCTFTPVPTLQLIPWIDFGIVGFAGRYEIDAGPARGVIQYQFPPENFVVGGSSDGFVGMGLPEIGIGGSIRIGRPDKAHVKLQGHYAVLEYDGNSSYFTTADHRDKNLELDHNDYRIRALVEFPRENGGTFFVGLQHESIDSHAELTTKERPIAETIARQERFDKNVDFEVAATTAIAGMTF